MSVTDCVCCTYKQTEMNVLSRVIHISRTLCTDGKLQISCKFSCSTISNHAVAWGVIMWKLEMLFPFSAPRGNKEYPSYHFYWRYGCFPTPKLLLLLSAVWFLFHCFHISKPFYQVLTAAGHQCNRK